MKRVENCIVITFPCTLLFIYLFIHFIYLFVYSFFCSQLPSGNF